MSVIKFDGQSLITSEAFRRDEGAWAPLAPATEAMLRTALVLSVAYDRFRAGAKATKTIDRLALELHDIRSRYPEDWDSLIPIIQQHDVAQYVLEDPLTRWSFDKPRGYSGDAHLLDLIYGHGSVQAELDAMSDLGRTIYHYTSNASSGVAVRERRRILTALVDEVSSANANTEILAVAAGHLREAEDSQALRENRILRWIALDQDPLSVGTVARDWRGSSIEAIDGSVRSLIKRPTYLGRFDLVYAAGLYDYLPRKVAIKLTKAALETLKPGGTFLFANFSDEIMVDGYMESFMNWRLLLRSEQEIWDIVNASVDRNQVAASVFHGENRNIVYARLSRAP